MIINVSKDNMHYLSFFCQAVTQLKVVPANSALRLRAILDFEEIDDTKRIAGDEWLFEGPGKRVIVCVLCPKDYIK